MQSNLNFPDHGSSICTQCLNLLDPTWNSAGSQKSKKIHPVLRKTVSKTKAKSFFNRGKVEVLSSELAEMTTVPVILQIVEVWSLQIKGRLFKEIPMPPLEKEVIDK